MTTKGLTGSSIVAPSVFYHAGGHLTLYARRRYCTCLLLYRLHDVAGLVCAIRWLVRWKPGRMSLEVPTS